MSKLRVLSALMLLLAASACYDKKDYTLTEPRVASILSLKSVSGATSIPADAVTRLSLVATVSPDADSNKRDVVFTTSAGTLIGGSQGTSASERVVSASADGHASIELQSSNQVQAAVVTAKVKNADGVVVTLTIQFVAVTADDVVRFVSAPSSAPADGFTLTPFTVAISPALTDRRVQFHTTSSTFAPGFTSPDATIPVLTDNTATVFLKSPGIPGSADITATSNGFTRSVTIQFVPVAADSIIRFVNTPSSPVPADGATITPLTVQVSSQLIGQTVSFTTSTGMIETNGVRVEADSTATGHLKSPGVISRADVTATINGFTRSTSVQFARALPDRIVATVSPATLTATATAQTTVTAMLTRDIGQVTIDTPVSFTAVDRDGNRIGSFTNVMTTNANGQATAVFLPGVTSYKGPVTLTATAQGASGGTVSGTVVLEITP